MQHHTIIMALAALGSLACGASTESSFAPKKGDAGVDVATTEAGAPIVKAAPLPGDGAGSASPLDGGTTTTTGGGTAPDGGVPIGAEGGAPTTPVCTSNQTWKNGDEASSLMRPGGACVGCHQQQGGPAYDVAGTVYPTLHEPDDCNGRGPPPALSVVITDAKNRQLTLPVNAVGNFFVGARLNGPLRVAVTDGTRTRAMAGPVTVGDCNSCHTEAGASGAPGRIMAP